MLSSQFSVNTVKLVSYVRFLRLFSSFYRWLETVPWVQLYDRTHVTLQQYLTFLGHLLVPILYVL